MEKLKVGDKMYNVKQNGFTDFARYSFSVVIELTKTLAVLKNGVRLINIPKISYIVEDIGFSVNRKKGEHWHHVSINAIRNAQIENKKIEAHDWFQHKEFSIEEKQLMFNYFKKLQAE